MEQIDKYCDYVLDIFDKNDFYIDIVEFIQQEKKSDYLEWKWVIDLSINRKTLWNK